ncbi:hypothetical protein [Aestuariivirga sp.]|uniref:hypothetical protein n=1 Tax=Aestuariivirga sp. TaxID=2650926 RepID=UPI0030172E36
MTAWPYGTLWALILGVGRPPGETTICEFDHRIEEQGLGKVVLAAANDHLKAIKSSARLRSLLQVKYLPPPFQMSAKIQS